MAVGCSDYFGSFYRKQRLRGKGANDAIIITARRMAKIAWKMLTDERNYMPQVPVAHRAKTSSSPAALVTD